MNTRDDRSNGHGGKGVPGQQGRERWYKPWNAEVMKERSDVQVDKILDAVGRDNVDMYRGPDGTVDFIWRRRLLTDVDDVPAVYDHLKRTPPPQSQRKNTKLDRLHRFDMDLAPGQDLEEVLDELDRVVRPGAVTPDYLLHVCTTWCGATEPQETTALEPVDRNTDPQATGNGIHIAIVDTGVLDPVIQDHSWLSDPPMVTGTDEPDDIGHYTGHGTFIAGVARAYAPKAEVFVECATKMGGTVFESDMVDHLVEAISRNPAVISFSGGTRTRANRPLKSFEMFYDQYLRDKQETTVFVAAAGNDGDNGPFWPAAFDWAVGVGALDDDRESVARYSNRGSWVNVYALGTDVVNAYPKITYVYQEPPERGADDASFSPNGMAAWSGTSFATPMVAGLIAARMSRSPGRTARAVANEILAFAANDADAQGRPRLRNADAATS